MRFRMRSCTRRYRQDTQARSAGVVLAQRSVNEVSWEDALSRALRQGPDGKHLDSRPIPWPGRLANRGDFNHTLGCARSAGGTPKSQAD